MAEKISLWIQRVRVSNELGAGNGKGVRFATIVSTTTSFLIGLFFSLLALAFHDKITLVVSSSKAVIDAVDNLSVLLAISILLNGVQPVLSGVAVGSGWQALVAYINVGSYYIIGVPVGLLLGWLFNLGVLGIWAGMIGGTAVQTIILAYITMRCDWDEEVISLSGPRLLKQVNTSKDGQARNELEWQCPHLKERLMKIILDGHFLNGSFS
ncbi:protein DETOXIFICATION 26-like [Aegilops tauschii subsp. strangulata]|uniref:Protein TRANSPARENT TESTA 12 n=1 Tax=Aegilops tauschii TaxID=37682 RepID=M8BNK3_AEGTA